MSNDREKAKQFFGKQQENANFAERQVSIETNAQPEFRGVFRASPLTQNEDVELQKLIKDMCPAFPDDAQIANDYKSLSDLIAQIRAIEKQAILLHGERIAKAQSILKGYKDGAFTRWLLVAYGNRQTPNAKLNYFNFYNSLEANDKKLMEAMPKKAAYILACRDGDRQVKIGIIKEHHASPAKQVIDLVQATFPLSVNDGRKKKKEHDLELVAEILNNVTKLCKRKDNLSSRTLEELADIRSLLDELLEKKQEVEKSVVPDEVIFEDLSSITMETLADN